MLHRASYRQPAAQLRAYAQVRVADAARVGEEVVFVGGVEGVAVS